MTDKNLNDDEEILAETDNYEVWVDYEEDDEPIYHLDVGRATLHFFQEEWNEFLQLVKQLDDE
jgi:hypothetical protein